MRRRLDIDFPGETLGVRAIVADVVCTGVGRDAWHRYQRGRVYLAGDAAHIHRRPAGRDSTPVCRMHTTSAGNWPRC